MEAASTGRRQTARERVLEILADHPEGLSKKALREKLDANSGVYRRLLDKMEDNHEITITDEMMEWGLTRIVRVAEPS